MRGRKTAVRMIVTDSEFDDLSRLARSRTEPAALVRRARVVLDVSQGDSFTEAAAKEGISFKRGRQWCVRFAQAKPGHRLQALHDLPGRGRKPRFFSLSSNEHCKDGLRATG